ncbi:MAG: hypothetical protein RLZZ241_2114 [Bacteroidota bacterium]|jgi:enoyl-CoA hydratase/carnithine racemase
MTEYTYLAIEQSDQVLSVFLNRESKRNAINTATILELEQVFNRLPPEIKCVILSGHGAHFCAGLDLSDLKESNAVEGLKHSRLWHRALNAIQNSPTPVIMVLKGACVGGGLELAATAHIRIAEASTFYALPEGQRGIFVGGGGSIRIPNLIGVPRMQDMMLTGRVYTAEEGDRVGFAQYLVPDGTGLEKAMDLSKKISKNAPMTNYALTNVLPRIVEAGTDVGLMLEAMTAAIAQEAPEAKQRLRDFLEGRAKKVGEI